MHEMLMKRKLRYVGAEVVFTDENDGVGSKEYIEKLHTDGKIVWANAIVYDYKVQLAWGTAMTFPLRARPKKAGLLTEGTISFRPTRRLRLKPILKRRAEDKTKIGTCAKCSSRFFY